MAKLTKRMKEKIDRHLNMIGNNNSGNWVDIWDSNLTIEENLKNILGTDKVLSKSEILAKKEKDEIEMKKIEEEYYKEEFNKRIDYIKQNNIDELRTYFNDYYNIIDKFLENNKINGFICMGNRGIGKTYNLLLRLKERGLNDNVVIVKGHLTAFELYKLLYENKEKKIIIWDDAISINNNDEIINLLLCVTDLDNKIVMWKSSSPLTSYLPEKFDFNSKIFILTNKLDENNEFIEALKDRCMIYRFDFTNQQIIEMLYIIAKKINYNLELVDYIKELCEKNAIKNLSLRLLHKIYNFDKHKNCFELIKNVIEIDEIDNIVFELIKSRLPVKEQIKEFTEKTGLSNRTYYRIKAKLKNCL